MAAGLAEVGKQLQKCAESQGLQGELGKLFPGVAAGTADKSVSRALAGRPLPPRRRPGSVEPAGVAAAVVGGLLVAGDVHQLEVLGGEEQAVEVLPVHLAALRAADGRGQRGHHRAPLLYSAGTARDVRLVLC